MLVACGTCACGLLVVVFVLLSLFFALFRYTSDVIDAEWGAPWTTGASQPHGFEFGCLAELQEMETRQFFDDHVGPFSGRELTRPGGPNRGTQAKHLESDQQLQGDKVIA